MKTLSAIINLSIAILFGCNKHNPTPATSNANFPNTVGNKWIYSVTDNSSNKTFPVTVAIVGNSTARTHTVTIWTLTYPTYVDTNYVYSDRDSAVFYDKTKSAIKKVYHFPLTVGNKWINSFIADTATVVSSSTLSVQAGTFGNTYLIHDKAISLNYNLDRNQWYVPGVGLIKMNFREYNLAPPITQSWELTQFHITP
ncbi:MAG TPA: hypothetical protein VNW51_07985 [Mucilaginibacter sp.]|jgi:hypothetical protein|nr:hypothetical protein [Mucilaginibacter sp.]